MFKNTHGSYGLISISLHWLIALGVFTLFGLGLWMVGLTYYSPYYRSAPDLHRSLGVLVVGFMILRLVWKLYNPKVQPLTSHKTWEQRLAKLTHALMYLLVIGLGVSGYMISTASGQPLMVFNLLSIPAIDFGIAYQEDIAGDLHEIIAWSLIGLVVIHVLGALKHHFIDRDATLKRMLSSNSTISSHHQESLK